MSEILVTAAIWSEDKEQLVELRTRVFVGEQKVLASLELDGLDADCLHVKALNGSACIGTGRLLPDGYIGRMCVASEFRNQGIGTLMLENLIQQAETAGHAQVMLNSQSYAIPFYQKNGFVIDSDEFIEAGIPHRHMVRYLADK
ncbi:MAG: GNAT family N-acetyltransferase [Gammaproteobacteria bacterium]|nr:GNAT family N-acetyltransferase [Gammaproteobacteria bacterium]